MKFDSYWTDSAPAYRPLGGDLPSQVDVAIVGAGFTGLSAALSLARRGASVAVLEASDRVAAEASGRNGGHVNNGLSIDYAGAARRFGRERARDWYHAYDDAVESVARVVHEEGIACDFLRTGKLKVALRPGQLEDLRRSADLLRADGVDNDIEVFDARRAREEMSSDLFHGGLLYKRSAQMHMGLFAHGLATAAEQRGARIHTGACVQRIERLGGTEAHRLHTTRGSVSARQVLLATGATRHGGYGSFGWLRRRIVPIGSFIVVTEPLGAARAQALLPGRRNYVTVANIHNYFRLSADHRLVFGGRTRFALSSRESDERSGVLLRSRLEELYPQLRGVRLDYCWGGLVDMTQDRLPHAGVRDGLYYSMGYSGHGVQMSVHMGERMAALMCGDARANPWQDRARWPAIPGHVGPPWFLPAVGLYFRLKDKVA